MEGGKEMNRAFTIVRVSAEDQLKGYGPDVQWEDDILPNAPLLGLTVSETHRRVIQESATGWERSKFEAAVREALALYGRGEIDALLFPRVDRETRFVFGSFPLLAEVVRSGLRVYFAREKLALDPTDPESIERYLTKATQAQAYVETMKVNTLRAKQKLVREGKLPQGTGRGLYGYKWDREAKKRLPLPFEVEVVKRAFGMIAEGKSRFCVAKTLNEQSIPTKGGGKWHPLTIGRMITNPAYVGITYFGKTRGTRKTGLKPQDKEQWKILPDATPPIINKDLFDLVQQVLRHSKEQRPAKVNRDYLLTGHIVCGKCGSPVTGSCLGRKHRYYRCRGTRPTASRGVICKACYMRADYLEGIVWQKVSEVLQDPDIILAELRRWAEANIGEFQAQDAGMVDKEIAKLQRKLKDYANQEKRLVYELRYGEITKDIVLDAINHFKRERDADRARLVELQEMKDRLATLVKAEVKLTEFCSRVHANLNQCTIQDKRLALDALDVRVTALSDQVKIQGVIPIELTHTQSSADVTTIEQTSGC